MLCEGILNVWSTRRTGKARWDSVAASHSTFRCAFVYARSYGLDRLLQTVCYSKDIDILDDIHHALIVHVATDTETEHVKIELDAIRIWIGLNLWRIYT